MSATKLTTTQLGRVVSIHRKGLFRRATHVLYAIIAIGVVILGFIALGSPEFGGFVEAQTRTLLALGLIVIAVVAVLVIYRNVPVMRIGEKVVIFDSGIQIIDQQGEHIYEWTYFNALSVSVVKAIPGAYPSTYRTYKLYVDDSPILEISNIIGHGYRQMDVMAKHLMERTREVFLQKAISAFNSGKTINFGDLRVDQKGVTMGKKSVQRSDINTWQIDGNGLTFTLHNGTKQKIRFGLDLPNAHILPQFIDTISK